jgi:hypothetical protein
MEIRAALKEQYHAGLANLAECVEKCSPELWASHHADRYVWRLAFHCAFYTHFYMAQGESAFERWPGDRMLPYEEDRPEGYSREEILNYIEWIDGIVDQTIDGLDLDSPETGFDWYPNMTKISHELMNLRHVQGHVGQISELIMALDPNEEIGWVAKAKTFRARDNGVLS